MTNLEVSNQLENLSEDVEVLIRKNGNLCCIEMHLFHLFEIHLSQKKQKKRIRFFFLEFLKST